MNFEPMSSQADDATRRRRIDTHTYIDDLWNTGPKASRGQRRSKLYRWIAEQLAIPEFHIGQTDKEHCSKVIGLVRQHSTFLRGMLHPDLFTRTKIKLANQTKKVKGHINIKRQRDARKLADQGD